MTIFLGYTLFLLLLAILFRSMFWDGGNFLCFVSIIQTVFILAISVTLFSRSTQFMKTIFIRAGILLAFTAILYFTPISTLFKVFNISQERQEQILNSY